jgi:membrane protein implicated in regulation of membrane protease activity
MNNNATRIELLFQKAADYGNTAIKLLQLKAIDKAADVVSTLVTHLAVIIAALLSFFLLTIGAALWIGKLLDNSFYGFFIVGIFYAIVAFALHLFKNTWIKKPLNNSIITQMMKNRIE